MSDIDYETKLDQLAQDRKNKAKKYSDLMTQSIAEQVALAEEALKKELAQANLGGAGQPPAETRQSQLVKNEEQKMWALMGRLADKK